MKLRPLYIDIIRVVTDTIDLHLKDEDFNCTRLAEILKMSRSQVHRSIKTHTGFSTLEFILNKRISKATELLNNSELSIKEISFEVGIYDPNYFTRVFTKKKGTSPTNFRNQLYKNSLKPINRAI